MCMMFSSRTGVFFLSTRSKDTRQGRNAGVLVQGCFVEQGCFVGKKNLRILAFRSLQSILKGSGFCEGMKPPHENI